MSNKKFKLVDQFGFPVDHIRKERQFVEVEFSRVYYWTEYGMLTFKMIVTDFNPYIKPSAN